MNDLTNRMMTDAEARECVAKINAGINNIRQLVIDLHDREGWSAMGYENWTACVEQEFKQCRSYIFFQYAAARIEMNVSGSTKVDLGKIPETHLRPLNRLEPGQQRIAWQQAVDTAPEGKVTAAHVSKVVKGMTEGPKVGKEEESDSLFQLKRWWKKATKKDKGSFLSWIEEVKR